MKKNAAELLIVLILAIPFIAAAFFWNRLPNRMAIHFNLEGQADGYGSKFTGLLLLPVVNVGIYLLMRFLPKQMTQASRFNQLEKRLVMIRLVLHTFVSALYLVIMWYTLHHAVNILLFLAYGVLAILLVAGNYLNNIKPNHFMGVRTPWTMKNDEVWRKTHFLTSRLWVAGALIMMCVLPFLSQLQATTVLLVYLTLICIIPVAYSWIIYKKSGTI